MNLLSTPGPTQSDPDSETSAREVRQFNGLFMLANAAFLLITWCSLHALA